jgi:hypothetical protein
LETLYVDLAEDVVELLYQRRVINILDSDADVKLYLKKLAETYLPKVICSANVDLDGLKPQSRRFWRPKMLVSITT